MGAAFGGAFAFDGVFVGAFGGVFVGAFCGGAFGGAFGGGAFCGGALGGTAFTLAGDFVVPVGTFFVVSGFTGCFLVSFAFPFDGVGGFTGFFEFFFILDHKENFYVPCYLQYLLTYLLRGGRPLVSSQHSKHT